jgi:hypothetical protein
MASAIIGALADLPFGFRTTFSITFEKIVPMLTAPGSSQVPPPDVIRLPTIVPVTREFFEADVTVEMPQAGWGSNFVLNIYGLADDIFSLLDPQRTIVHVSLGYADGSSSEVITGLLTEKRLAVASDGCFYQAELKGVDYVFDRLQYPPQNIKGYKSHPGKTIGQIASEICDLANVPKQIKIDGPPVDPLTFDNYTPLRALQELARRGDYVLQIKDGNVWMGALSDLGADHPAPIKDGATSKPVTSRGGTPSSSPSDGQDFDMAGDPTLRPNDPVTFGTNNYRIESVTHKLTRDGGYRCVGRALSVDASIADQKMAGRPTASQVARAIHEKLSGREQIRPAISTGEVADYTEGRHTASLNIGVTPTADMSNPTVQAPLRKDPGQLPDKPIASPFAFGPCGLVVPVYSKMRTLLAHGWNDPNDAVIDGFLWTKDMTPPPNKPGDWWLCLPTQLDGDGLPAGATADDLTTADGQRVISVKGMKITVGSGLLNQIGSRPSPGSDESLTITTDQGATITVQGSQIQLSDGSVTLTVGNGKVNIE